MISVIDLILSTVDNINQRAEEIEEASEAYDVVNDSFRDATTEHYGLQHDIIFSLDTLKTIESDIDQLVAHKSEELRMIEYAWKMNLDIVLYDVYITNVMANIHNHNIFEVLYGDTMPDLTSSIYADRTVDEQYPILIEYSEEEKDEKQVSSDNLYMAHGSSYIIIDIRNHPKFPESHEYSGLANIIRGISSQMLGNIAVGDTIIDTFKVTANKILLMHNLANRYQFVPRFVTVDFSNDMVEYHIDKEAVVNFGRAVHDKAWDESKTYDDFENTVEYIIDDIISYGSDTDYEDSISVSNTINGAIQYAIIDGYGAESYNYFIRTGYESIITQIYNSSKLRITSNTLMLSYIRELTDPSYIEHVMMENRGRVDVDDVNDIMKISRLLVKEFIPKDNEQIEIDTNKLIRSIRAMVKAMSL